LDEKFSFRYSCQTQNGSSGSPVINLINHKVIGIHKSYKENLKYNIGTVLKDQINDFYLNIINPKVDNLENKESDEFLEKSLKNIGTVLKDQINDFYLNIKIPKVDNLENKESDEFLEKSLKNIGTVLKDPINDFYLNIKIPKVDIFRK